MKASVIREMSSAEIRERIDTEKTSYLKMKMNHVVSNLENPIKLKFARKAIARLSTELTKREKAEAVSNGNAAQANTTAVKSEDKATAEEVKEEEKSNEETVEAEIDENLPTEKEDEKA